MRQIGTIADEDQARLLADYLLTLDIGTQVVASKGGGHAVWVRREEQVDRARREMAEFLKDPADPRYQGISQAARQIRKQAERKERLHQKNTISLSGRWGYRNPGRCPLTLLLMVGSILVSVLSDFAAREEVLRPLYISTFRIVLLIDPGTTPPEELEGPPAVIRSGGLEPILHGEVWRLVSPIFIHMSIFHLLFNMLWLYDLGGLVEMRKGTLYLGALVLVSAVASNLGEFAWSHFRNPFFGGMSGVVYALFGFVWMRSRHDPEGGMYLRPSTVYLMLIWAGYCMLNRALNVANAAHVVGLLVGVIWGVAPYWRQELRRWM